MIDKDYFNNQIHFMDGEKFKPIKGFVGNWVSNMGRIVSVKSSGDFYLKKGGGRRPAVILQYVYDGELIKRNVAISVLVAKAFLDRPPKSKQVKYKNRNRYDNRASNLYWVVPESYVYQDQVDLPTLDRLNELKSKYSASLENGEPWAIELNEIICQLENKAIDQK